MPKIEVNSFVQLLMYLEGLKGSVPIDSLSLLDGLSLLMDGAAEYIASLEKRDDWLSCLEWAGVDNWQGYEHAYEIQREYFPDRVED